MAPPLNTWKVRPLLNDSNKSTWPLPFRKAWDSPDWSFYMIAEGHPLWPTLIDNTSITSLTFYYPGPCGTTSHTLLVAYEDHRKFVFWVPLQPSTQEHTTKDIVTLQPLVKAPTP